jgi:FSR family fosmidomycin resistance protein-like MFS transporter
MRLLRNLPFLAVSLGHLSVDLLNGQTGVLLAVVSTPLNLTNQTIGLIATLYSMAGALGQPVFGWVADRFGGRWVTAGGVLWMTACFTLVAVAPGYWPLAFLVIGSLGSAAFHPPGTAQATQMGKTLWMGRAAVATSIFFLFGQAGLSLGPALSGFIIDHLNRPGLLILTALITPVGLFAARELREGAEAAAPAKQDVLATPLPPPQSAVLITIMLVSGLRVWAQMATNTFAPKYFHDLNMSPTEYGLLTAMFMAGSAIGGVIGAALGHRWGNQRIVTSALGLGIIPFIFFPLAKGWLLYLVVALSGTLNGAPHSILITMAQKALPGRAATASGAIMGFMFAVGATGVYFSGLVADQIGLGGILQGNALISLVAALASLGLMVPTKKTNPAILPLGD